jgi:hypothetical protein
MQMTYENGEIVIRIPANDDAILNAPLSKSGKSHMIGSTNNVFAKVAGAPEGISVKLFAIAKA